MENFPSFQQLNISFEKFPFKFYKYIYHSPFKLLVMWCRSCCTASMHPTIYHCYVDVLLIFCMRIGSPLPGTKAPNWIARMKREYLEKTISNAIVVFCSQFTVGEIGLCIMYLVSVRISVLLYRYILHFTFMDPEDNTLHRFFIYIYLPSSEGLATYLFTRKFYFIVICTFTWFIFKFRRSFCICSK